LVPEKELHSLDSDEEAEEDTARYALTEDDLHEDLDTGVMALALSSILHTKFTDGGVEVTPFNLNREMEEGFEFITCFFFLSLILSASLIFL
jgi:hypothetical protein